MKSHLSLPGGSHSRGRNPTPRSSLAHARVCSCHPPFSVSSFFSFSANSPTRLSSAPRRSSSWISLLNKPKPTLTRTPRRFVLPFVSLPWPTAEESQTYRPLRPVELSCFSRSVLFPSQGPPRVLKQYSYLTLLPPDHPSPCFKTTSVLHLQRRTHRGILTSSGQYSLFTSLEPTIVSPTRA